MGRRPEFQTLFVRCIRANIKGYQNPPPWGNAFRRIKSQVWRLCSNRQCFRDSESDQTPNPVMSFSSPTSSRRRGALHGFQKSLAFLSAMDHKIQIRTGILSPPEASRYMKPLIFLPKKNNACRAVLLGILNLPSKAIWFGPEKE